MGRKHVVIEKLVQKPSQSVLSLIGQKFNKILVQSYLGHGWNHAYYKCVCDCGKDCVSSRFRLRRGITKQCNACSTRSGKDHYGWSGHGDISGEWWNRLPNEAKNRGLVFEITIEDAWELFLKQGKKCALSGLPLCFKKENNSLAGTTASLDRIDSSRGYTLDNIQWLHKAVNHVKSSAPNDLFILMCNLIAKTNPTMLTDEYFAANYHSLIKSGFNKQVGDNHVRSKTYRILHLDGTEEVIKGLTTYCRKLKIHPRTLSKTLKSGKFYRGLKVLSVS